MGSVTMDSFINIFLDMLHYVPYITTKSSRYNSFWDFFLQIFKKELILTCPKIWLLPCTRIDFVMNMDNWDRKIQTEFKTSLGPSWTIKNLVLSHIHIENKTIFFYLTKISTRQVHGKMCPHQIPTIHGGAKDSPLQVSCWKFQGPHYAKYCPNKTNGVLQNLQEYPIVEDMASTHRIYAILGV